MYLLSSGEGAFLVQHTRSWWIPNSTTLDLLIFWEELVKTWSMSVALLLVTLLGIEKKCSKEKEKQISR